MSTKGLFITLEGGEGAGKSTQVARLAEWYRRHGHEVVTTREPGGSPGAEEIRALLVRGEAERWTPITEALLMNAARADHLARTIRPALERGAIVICDRFADSTEAYQGAGGGVSLAEVTALRLIVVGETMPDLTFIFDLPVEAGLARAEARGGDSRFESKGLDYHQRLREAYGRIAARDAARCTVIDATQPIEDVTTTLLMRMDELLHARGLLR